VSQRIFKDYSESGRRKYIVDIAGALPVILMELNNSGDIVKTYIYANSQIIAQHTGDHEADRYFYLHDRLGSVRQIIDTSGSVKNRYTYDPFGEVGETFSSEVEEDQDLDNVFKFAGQYFDSEIDEYYLRAHQYDPHIARFTARDPAFGRFKEPLTLHVYLYCGNDPVNRIDTNGKLFFTTASVIAGITISDAFRHTHNAMVAKAAGAILVAVGALLDYYLIWPTAKDLDSGTINALQKWLKRAYEGFDKTDPWDIEREKRERER
jgi:RHS repeat-associated protein